MPIKTRCRCGKTISVNDDLAGQSVTCMQCARDVLIPGGAPAARETAKAEAAPVPRPPRMVVESSPVNAVRDSLYWMLALAFVPLALMLGQARTLTMKQRIDEDLRQAPVELRQEIDLKIASGEADLDDVLAMMPNKQLSTAYLPRKSGMHWAYAMVAAFAFAVVIALCFAPGSAHPASLVAVGVFTATIGIVLLFMVHSIPPFSILIDFCMLSADNPNASFFEVLIGFTFGVGVVEELCKLGPLLWYWHRFRGIPWRTACLWGLASGVGFGVSEGVMYSKEFYNGIEDGMTYLVRFASCVALHAIWAASAGITLASNQDLMHALYKETRHSTARGNLVELEDGAVAQEYMAGPVESPSLVRVETTAYYLMMVWGAALLRVLMVVVFLHGLYDTALTRQKYFLALVTALASFAWLAWQVESCRREEMPAGT